MKLKVITVVVLTLFLASISTLAFNIQPVKASGTIYIRADGSVDPLTAPISSVDNVTYTFTDNIFYETIAVERDNIVIDGKGYRLQGNGTGWAFNISNIFNVTIKDTTIIGFGAGILMDHSTNNRILHNSVMNNDEWGILMDYASNNILESNVITGNHVGIDLWRASTKNIIKANEISWNTLHGITLMGESDNNLISANTIANNWEYGIHLCTGGNIVNGNRVTGEGLRPLPYHGILVVDGSHNTILNNTITAFRKGIAVYSRGNTILDNTIKASEHSIAVYWYGGNIIYHNNFYAPAFTDGSPNKWYKGYPSGGNYWSFHVCNGNPSNGSQPYIIDANNIDHYPFRDQNGWLKVHNVNSSLDYATIQEAIDAPETLDGHRIMVDAGTCYEHVTIDKSLTLMGESKETTIIDGNGTGNVVYISVENVSLSGFTIQKSGSNSQDSGIYVDHSSGNKISNNIIINNANGISLFCSSNNILTGNNASSSMFSGIWLVDSSNNILSGNFIGKMGLGIYVGIGIYLSDSGDCTISNNTVTENSNNGLHIVGSGGYTICNNTITNNGNMGIYLGAFGCTISNNTVTGSRWYGIYVLSSLDNTITGNTLTKNRGGIYLSNSVGCILRDNDAFGNSYNFAVEGMGLSPFIHDIDTSNTVEGKPIYYWIDQHNKTIPGDAGYVALVKSTNITVKGLNLVRNFHGVLFVYTTNSTISDNNIGNNYDGIYAYYSGGCTITGNNITRSSEGIYLHCSDSCTITGNTVTENWRGMLISASSDCVISRNNLTNNSYGIGIFWPSSGNIIYHNNFIGNKYDQVLTEQAAINTWDEGYPSGGNYWSDYTGVDYYSGPYQNETGSDGIGDTPYVINKNNQDRYPLMNPWSPVPLKVFKITWHEQTHQVLTLSNSTITHFIFNQPSKQIIFKVTGPEGTIGFCNVTIPKALLKADPYWNWTILLNGANITQYAIILKSENYTFIHFTYNHTTQNVQIIGTWVVPEFPSAMILPVLLIIALIAVILAKRTLISGVLRQKGS